MHLNKLLNKMYLTALGLTIPLIAVDCMYGTGYITHEHQRYIVMFIGGLQFGILTSWMMVSLNQIENRNL